MTKLQQIIAEHEDDQEALIEALASFTYRAPDPRPEKDPEDPEWWYGTLDYEPGRDTLGELETRVATGELSREVYNAVVERVAPAQNGEESEDATA